MIEVDRDFESRNWLRLVRLVNMGFSTGKAKELVKDVEIGKITFHDILKLPRK